jgi:hypothetical protein
VKLRPTESNPINHQVNDTVLFPPADYLLETCIKCTFANKEAVLELNGCSIKAYPSNHLDAYRALDNPKFILLDEADFFRKSEQEDVRPQKAKKKTTA